MLIFEYAAVAVIVVTCSVFSAWRLLSVRLRLSLLERLGGLLAKGGREGVVTGWVTHLRRKTLAQLGTGCNTCALSEHHKPTTAPQRGSSAKPGTDVSATFRSVNRSSAAPHR